MEFLLRKRYINILNLVHWKEYIGSKILRLRKTGWNYLWLWRMDNVLSWIPQMKVCIFFLSIHLSKLQLSATSNWMCFVRRAETYEEQNLVLIQQDGSLYYVTKENILPKQELKVVPLLILIYF